MLANNSSFDHIDWLTYLNNSNPIVNANSVVLMTLLTQSLIVKNIPTISTSENGTSRFRETTFKVNSGDNFTGSPFTKTQRVYSTNEREHGTQSEAILTLPEQTEYVLRFYEFELKQTNTFSQSLNSGLTWDGSKDDWGSIKAYTNQLVFEHGLIQVQMLNEFILALKNAGGPEYIGVNGSDVVSGLTESSILNADAGSLEFDGFKVWQVMRKIMSGKKFKDVIDLTKLNASAPFNHSMLKASTPVSGYDGNIPISATDLVDVTENTITIPNLARTEEEYNNLISTGDIYYRKEIQTQPFEYKINAGAIKTLIEIGRNPITLIKNTSEVGIQKGTQNAMFIMDEETRSSIKSDAAMVALVSNEATRPIDVIDVPNSPRAFSNISVETIGDIIAFVVTFSINPFISRNFLDVSTNDKNVDLGAVIAIQPGDNFLTLPESYDNQIIKEFNETNMTATAMTNDNGRGPLTSKAEWFLTIIDKKSTLSPYLVTNLNHMNPRIEYFLKFGIQIFDPKAYKIIVFQRANGF